MQIPIINGIYSGWRTAYPVNLQPVPKSTGISEGYLQPSDGVIALGTGPGVCRGAINWDGVCYAVMGDQFGRFSAAGVFTSIGTVTNDSRQVTMDYSFDRLAIASAGKFYYYDGATLSQVTDPDLRTVLDFVWVDGYFLTTDGTSIIQTELTNPNSVNPLKYGSSEVDPDPITSMLKLRNEVYVLNRHTVEEFENVGGEFFAFARIPGAQMQKGCVGTHAACIYADAIAFLGGARDEAPAIYLGANAATIKISTQEIDEILMEFTEDELSQVVIEARNDRSNQLLYVHLPNRTLVYDYAASQAVGVPAWHIVTSAISGFSRYRIFNMTWCYDRWLVFDPLSSAIGQMTNSTPKHWGSDVRWEFNTRIGYNEGMGAVFHELELVALTGDVDLGSNPTISTSYSFDSVTWSMPRFIRVGTIGQRLKRLVWFRQGNMRQWRIQRFQGTTAARLTVARLEAKLEPLAV
jgi:hypothetical protein